MTRHHDTPAGRPATPSLPVRTVEVRAVRRLTPRMVRVTFGDPASAALVGDAPDQQVKLYFPGRGSAFPGSPRPAPTGT